MYSYVDQAYVYFVRNFQSDQFYGIAVRQDIFYFVTSKKVKGLHREMRSMYGIYALFS